MLAFSPGLTFTQLASILERHSMISIQVSEHELQRLWLRLYHSLGLGAQPGIQGNAVTAFLRLKRTLTAAAKAPHQLVRWMPPWIRRRGAASMPK
jgi:hypothetical protein